MRYVNIDELSELVKKREKLKQELEDNETAINTVAMFGRQTTYTHTGEISSRKGCKFGASKLNKAKKRVYHVLTNKWQTASEIRSKDKRLNGDDVDYGLKCLGNRIEHTVVTPSFVKKHMPEKITSGIKRAITVGQNVYLWKKR